MDAISFLLKEHKKFRSTLKALSKMKQTNMIKPKFNALCKALTVHETMEQKAWYPTLRKHKELRSIIKHLLGEEKSAAQAIKKFKKVEFELMWKLRFYKFKHDVEHHADEEEQELFPKVRKLLTKAELTALGTKMRKYKAKHK